VGTILKCTKNSLDDWKMPVQLKDSSTLVDNLSYDDSSGND